MAPLLNLFTEEQMQKAAQKLKEQVGSTDVEISFDGSWRKKGHTSLSCIAFAISVATGN
jgi:hypothetical protein